MNIREESKKIAEHVLKELNTGGWKASKKQCTIVFEKVGFPIMVQYHTDSGEIFLNGKCLEDLPYFLNGKFGDTLRFIWNQKQDQKKMAEKIEIITQLKNLLDIK
jgi:hypothetical protein